MMLRRLSLTHLWPLALCGLVLLVYYVGLHGPYYLDDYLFFFDPPPDTLFHYFTHGHSTGFYRPLQATFLLLVQRYFGLETWPIHLTQLALHLLLSVIVYRWMLCRRFSFLQAATGSLFVAVSQAAATAVMGNDTLSQVACAVCGWGSVWAFEETLMLAQVGDASSRPVARFTGLYVLSLLLFAGALFSKEHGVCFLLLLVVVPALTIILPAFHAGGVMAAKAAGTRLLLLWLPFLLVFAGYFGARQRVGSATIRFGEQRYDVRLGLNVPQNAVQFLLCVALPVSTSTVFLALVERRWSIILLAVVLTVLFLLLVGWGLRRAGAGKLAFGVIIAAMLGLVPVIFLNKVSELYTYNALPALGVLVGVTLGALLERALRMDGDAPGRGIYRVAAVGVAGLLLANGIGSWTKARQMAENGVRQSALMDSILSYRERLKPGATLILVSPPPPPLTRRANYSVLVQHDFSVLRDSEARLVYLMSKPGVKVRIVESRKGDDISVISPGDLVLTVDPGGVNVHPLSPGPLSRPSWPAF